MLGVARFGVMDLAFEMLAANPAVDPPIDQRCFVATPCIADSHFVDITATARGGQRCDLGKRTAIEQKPCALEVGIGGFVLAQLGKTRTEQNLGVEAIDVGAEPLAQAEQEVDGARGIGFERDAGTLEDPVHARLIRGERNAPVGGSGVDRAGHCARDWRGRRAGPAERTAKRTTGGLAQMG